MYQLMCCTKEIKVGVQQIFPVLYISILLMKTTLFSTDQSVMFLSVEHNKAVNPTCDLASCCQY